MKFMNIAILFITVLFFKLIGNAENLDCIKEKINHVNYYNGQLCNNPKPLPYQTEPQIIFYKEYKNEDVEYSVVTPIFNQEYIIENNILSVIKNIEDSFEVILILDYCLDNTKSVLLNLFYNLNVDNLVRVIIVEQGSPVFETTCDNIGFILSSGKYIIEIQADMEMVEWGFNTNLARGFKKYDDIIGISGRCSVTFEDFSIGKGKLGTTILEPLSSDLDRNSLYMYGTCNRGPLLLDREKLIVMKYLDEQNFYLDNSDHDLFARAYYLNSWKCGYIPMEFKSPLENGSTRKSITPAAKSLNEYVRFLKNQRSNNGFWGTISGRTPPPIEIRPL